MPGARSWTDLDASVLFEKVLTSSDINPQGRIVVPKVVTSLVSDTVYSVLDVLWQAIHLQANMQSCAVIYLVSLRLPYGTHFVKQLVHSHIFVEHVVVNAVLPGCRQMLKSIYLSWRNSPQVRCMLQTRLAIQLSSSSASGLTTNLGCIY